MTLSPLIIPYITQLLYENNYKLSTGKQNEESNDESSYFIPGVSSATRHLVKQWELLIKCNQYSVNAVQHFTAHYKCVWEKPHMSNVVTFQHLKK